MVDYIETIIRMRKKAEEFRLEFGLQAAYGFLMGWLFSISPIEDVPKILPKDPPKKIILKKRAKLTPAIVIRVMQSQKEPITMPEIRELVSIEHNYIASQKQIWNIISKLEKDEIIIRSKEKVGKSYTYTISPEYNGDLVIEKNMNP